MHERFVHNFNPHPRVGGDTDAQYGQLGLTPISIHTPAWGVTHDGQSVEVIMCNFNPHPRVGGDISAHLE